MVAIAKLNQHSATYLIEKIFIGAAVSNTKKN